MRCLKNKIFILLFLLIFITGCEQTGVMSPNFDGEVIADFTAEQKREEGQEIAGEKVDDPKKEKAQESQENEITKEKEESIENGENEENEEPQEARDSEEVILATMKEKYKLYKKAWRISEREEDETPLEYFQRNAQRAVSKGLVQEGIDFFTGPPRGYSSSKTEILIEAEVRSRIIDQAVITSTWEQVIIGDGLFTKDISDITIKMKKEEGEWLITDLEYDLVSQEELDKDLIDGI